MAILDNYFNTPCLDCMAPSIQGSKACKTCKYNSNTASSDRPSWQDTYFEIAKIVAKRSKDPHTKVGAVIVKDNHILGIGYNGEPRNFTHEFDWHSKEKYQYVIHAEMNAITNATTIGANVVGADIYLTLSPCTECMKLLIQNRIKTVYFLEKYTDFDKSQMMAEHSDIKLVHVGGNVNE